MPLKGTPVDTSFTILVADRNRHVRDFLRRELETEGYRVIQAKNGREVIEALYSIEDLDLIILDLDQPDVNDRHLIEKLANRIPSLPVIIHSHLSDYNHPPFASGAAAMIEKDGYSIDRLKRVVYETLRHAEGDAGQRRSKKSTSISVE